MENGIPKIVRIRINRAQGLAHNQSIIKKKKSTAIWRVVCSGGSKKQITPGVEDPSGNPVFNCDVHLKISRKHSKEPISLLVMDSLENPVGQVLLMPQTIPPLVSHDVEFRNENDKSISRETLENIAFSPQFLRYEELEATKKNSAPQGHLYFWCFVEEYREGSSKSSTSRKGSLMVPGGPAELSGSSSKLSRSTLSLMSRSKLDLKGIFSKSRKKSNASLASGLSGSSANIANYPGNRSPGGLQNSPDEISLSDSHSSVMYHEEVYRERADGCGDSETSSVQHQEVPYTNHPQPLTSDLRYGSSTALYPQNLPRFRVEPSEGALREAIHVRLRAQQPDFVKWVRNCVVSVRVGDHSLAVSECLFIPSEAEAAGDWVRITLPPQNQPISCHIELETPKEGRIPSENVFTFSSSSKPPVSPTKSNQSLDSLRRGSLPVGGLMTSRAMPPPSHLALQSTTSPGPGSKLGSYPAAMLTSSNKSATLNHSATNQHHRYQSEGQWNKSNAMTDQNVTAEEKKSMHKKSRSFTKKDLLEENVKLQRDNTDLRTMVHQKEQVCARLQDENVTISSRLVVRDREIEELRQALCNLKLRLLLDGRTEYLEVNRI